MSQWFDSFGYAQIWQGEQGGRLLLGAYPTDPEDVAALAAEQVSRVASLCQDCEYPPQVREQLEAAYGRAGIQEQRFPSPDFESLDYRLIRLMSRQVIEWLQEGETVYLHCRAGWQRSATVASAIISQLEGCPWPQALARIQQARPQAQPLEEQLAALRVWGQSQAD